jgi:NADH-quinone oxidoreductase subunit J
MFYLLSFVIVVFSFLTIFSRKILRAAVSLLFVLVATSGLYFMLDYQFMAGVQLALYAGGIVVLIIFSILLTSHISQRFEVPGIMHLVFGGLIAIVGATLAIMSILKYPFQSTNMPAIQVNMQEIGTQLMGTGYNGYALPFEVISVLLLAAMIAAIIIAKKED